MNERISGISNIRYNCDSDKSFMGRRRLNKQKSNKKDLDFDSIFQKELKRVRKERLMKASECKDLNLDKERQQFAVMIGIYLGIQCKINDIEVDDLDTISKIVDFSQTHDFDMMSVGDDILIDTGLARNVAKDFIKNDLVKNV